MKPGDKVWFFAEEKIKSFLFEGYDIGGAICGRIDKDTRVIITHPESVPIFPTREALCEHYRKIFE